MIRYKQLITLKVLDKNSDKPIGNIIDVLYSEDYRRVNYLIIKNNNLINNKIIVDYNNFSFQKNNRILYTNNKDISNFKMYKYIENANKGYKLIDKEIRNEEEECVGLVKDVVIDQEKGKVDGFIVTEGLFEDLLKGRNYIPLIDTIKIHEQCIYIPSNIFV